MCGICGLMLGDSTRTAEMRRVEAMSNAMIHRGPDDAGLWNGGHVILAMRRLSILDLPGGHQPMTNEDGSVVVVFNGEIYNFHELRKDLLAKGHRFTSTGDTETLVHGYEEYGDDLLNRLNGMFAFAVYDRSKNRLLLARDRLGIKPLFYRIKDGGIAFASELEALARSGLSCGPINAAALDAYFTFLYVPAPDTIYKEVFKLLPGEKLVFERGEVRRERYWQPEFSPDAEWTLETAAERYRELVEDAVGLQRISDVPLGAFLSGGIDSSTVVAVLSQLSNRPVKTFTIGFEGADGSNAAYNELEYARAVAARFQTEHTEEILKPDAVAAGSSLVRHFGEPFADSSAIPTWLVSQTARKHVTVALSGDGGDESFAGYTWLHRTRRVAELQRIPHLVRRFAADALGLAPDSPAAARLRRAVNDSFLEPRDIFRRRETCFSDPMRKGLFLPHVAQEVVAEHVDRFEEHADRGPSSLDEWMLNQDTVMYLPDDILTKVDRMSMAVSLEARVPLLDHRIVEFAASLPFSLKFQGGVSKIVPKHAFRDLLPAEILSQRKQGFAIPIHQWFRGELQNHFESTVLAPDSRCAAWLSREAIADLFQAHLAAKDNYGHHLWAVLQFEHWLRYAEG